MFFQLQPPRVRLVQQPKAAHRQYSKVKHGMNTVKDHTKGNSGQTIGSGTRGKHEKQQSEKRACRNAEYLSSNYSNMLFSLMNIKPTLN